MNPALGKNYEEGCVVEGTTDAKKMRGSRKLEERMGASER